MKRLPLPAPPQARSEYVPFTGGIDTETPPIETRPGSCSDAINYEIGVEGGYVDIQGYERVDGRPAPSSATYSILRYVPVGTISVGDTITGADSSATAKVLLVTDDYLVITKVVGTFDDAEDLEVSAVVEGTTTSEAVVFNVDTQLMHSQYLALAADEYRNDIAAVPGEGSILGVVALAGVRYAWRNAVGGASAKLYKSTSSGWTEVALGRQLQFTSGGTYEIQVGDTITGNTGAATAVVTGVIVRTGSWAAGTAAGTIVFASQTGTFVSENLNVGANLNVASITGNSSATVLAPSGRYECVIHQFESIGTPRIWGADRVNKAFSFDGTTYIQITTGMTVDTPNHVRVHSNHLFLAFGAVNQHSGLGFPYAWEVVSGAAALALGAQITGYSIEPGAEGNASLLITAQDQLWMLYGNSSLDWNLVRYREQVGARAHTLQQIGLTVMLDDVGITSFRTAQAFGNFSHSSLTQHIRGWLNPKRSSAVASCVVRDKNQYRLFFSDGYAVYMTMAGGNKIRGVMPVFFPDAVTCCWRGETSQGEEEIYFGSDNGMVYQLDCGTSFDGTSIDAFFTLHPLRQKANQYQKSYHNLIMESAGDGYAEWSVGYLLDYGTTKRGQQAMPKTEIGDFSTATRWDDPAASWDANLYWDAVGIKPSAAIRIRGAGENITFTIAKSSNAFVPVRHSGGNIRYTLRRLKT